MNNNATVKAILRSDKTPNQDGYPINYRITINRQTLKLPSGERCHKDRWDSGKGLPKGKGHSLLSSKIERQVGKYRDYILAEELKGNDVTLDDVKDHFTTEKEKGFYEIVEDFKKKRYQGLSEGTIGHYELVVRSLKEFKTKVNLNSINLKFVEDFDEFLDGKKAGIDGKCKHHKKLRAIINFAIKTKRLTWSPYTEFKILEGDPQFDYLTDDEISALCFAEFPNTRLGNGMELTRDMFMFGCYTGLRYSDVSAIKKTDVFKGSHISIKTQKTKKWVNIPLMPQIEELINKYSDPSRAEIFPYRSNQCCNRDLKKIAADCGIEKNIHFHISRHTFATCSIADNTNPIIVSSILRHTNMKQTMAYVTMNMGAEKKQLQNVSLFKQYPQRNQQV